MKAQPANDFRKQVSLIPIMPDPMNRISPLATLGFITSMMLTQTLSAQLVYIPDVLLRGWFNSTVPGSVDANGYLDTSLPALAAVDSVTIQVGWYPNDMTGIEHLTGLHYLFLDMPFNQSSFISAFPPALEHLRIREYGGTFMPAFPAGLTTLHLNGVDSVTSLPLFPAGLEKLLLGGLASLEEVPQLPAGLVEAQLETMPALTVQIVLPEGIDNLRLGNFSSTDMLPALPEGITDLQLYNMPYDMGSIDWPDSIVSLAVGNVEGSLGPFPISLRNLIFTGAVDEIASFPDSLQYIYFMTGVGTLPPCLPHLPDSLDWIEFPMMPLGSLCLPNIPTNPEFQCFFCPYELCTIYNSNCPSDNGVVTGAAFWDQDADGVHDAGEPPLSGTLIHIDPGFMTHTNMDGWYSRGVLDGGYTITAEHPSPYFTGTLPVAHAAAIASPTDIDSLNDFGVTFLPDVQDLHLVMSTGSPRPGFVNNAWITFSNIGTIPMDGSVSLTYDAAQTFASSSVAPDLLVGQTLTWNFADLQVGEARSIMVSLSTPVGTPLGTLVAYDAVVGPVATDEAPADNAMSTTETVVNSFDPNDKQVVPTVLSPDDIAAGTRVEYMIRFQNTGTYAAERVLVTDSLSASLQWPSFQLVATSHSCTWYMENGVLFFLFENIQLPDSGADEPGSHGFVRFSLVPHQDLMAGAVVPNAAAIYFDFNEAVITNDAPFSVEVAQGIASRTDGFRVYPNPVGEELIIVAEGHGAISITILDALGRVVQRATGQGSRFSVQVGTLSSGGYTAKLSDGSTERTVHFIKR